MSYPDRRAWPLALLVVALLLGIWTEAEHLADLEAHEAGEICSVCLFTSLSGHGLPPALPLRLQFQKATPAPRYETGRAIISIHLHGYYPQRGPPPHA